MDRTKGLILCSLLTLLFILSPLTLVAQQKGRKGVKKAKGEPNRLEVSTREQFKPRSYIPDEGVFTDKGNPVFKARRDKTASSKNRLNSFNRLFKWQNIKPWAPPAEDGLHDPSLKVVKKEILAPEEGMKNLYKDKYGNLVNWVNVLGLPSVSNPDLKKPEKQINPIKRLDKSFPDMMVLNMNVEIPAVGMINNVIFPHAGHTGWLSCSNCHVAQSFKQPIFVPKKGANPITMKAIARGEFCGVCHSGEKEKVAFPIDDCARCHSGPAKTKPTPIKAYMKK